MKLRVKFPLLIGLAVAIVLGVSGYLTYSFQHDLVIGQAERQARMLSRQILLTRRWVTDHDGLFVTKKPGTGGSPAPTDGDVVDQSGQVYVKRNPGMIIWDLSDYAAQADFCRFRVTSLRPVNPANAPDDFERQGLLDFETGREEVSEISSGKQGRILRYMIPLKVEESCLPCHAEHGYQVGNIRGGLSLEVPLGWADEAIEANDRLLLLVGLVGVVVVALVTFLLMNAMVVRRLAGLAGAMAQFPQLAPTGNPPVGTDEIDELTGAICNRGERLARSQTELVLIREQLCQNEKQAAVGELAATIAHEVNTPVGSMCQCVKNLRDAPEQQELRDRCLDTLDVGLLRIAHVVRQLLNSGQEMSFRSTETEIDRLIRNCFDLLAFQVRKIKLKFDLAVSGNCLVDGGVLNQVLVNVAMNAVLGTPEGGELLVSSREESGQVAITMRNHGPGIPPGDLDRLHEPFSLALPEGAGCGLTLAVAFSLIKRLGGQLRVESRPGEGTLFTIELPRQPPGNGRGLNNGADHD
jgi:signal transduction histidine kinase